MENQPLFTEKQYFRQLLVIGLLVFINLFFIYGFVQQIILGHPFGTKSAPDAVLIIFLIGSFLLTYFMWTAHLATTISVRGIAYQFHPFQRKPTCIPWREIKACYVRKYSPLKEYGGWGYRNYPKNSAFNVSGNTGIQIVLHTKEYVLLGTNKGDQAQRVIDSMHNLAE
ncbi:hypothetical protein [Spirosoma validum]|uniref:Uncharacterized protein n=1 Tax=Spirosoma validum TaxID=2771355 RepID=A0A927GG98_9BACT|nr:hypothetical protein [Spirosoma validum]MBD2756772.1 hypothetical protein [Spirosoma validum]